MVRRHASYPDRIKQLKQAQGQLGSLLLTFAERRACLELAEQLRAANSVIHNAKRTLIRDVKRCIGDAVGKAGMNAEQALGAFKSMLTTVKDWLGFGRQDQIFGHSNGEGAHGHESAGGQGHKHGVIDCSLSSSGSVALLADTIHNIGDATTAIPLWIAFALARRKPTATFNYGLGRVEDLAGMLVVLIILFSAIIAGYEAISRLIHPQPITHLVAVAAAGVIGFIGNEAVAVFRIRVGRAMNSAALIADGYHARTYGLTSLAVALGAGGAWAGFSLADPVIGLLITVAIFGVVWQSAKAVITRSLDGVSPGVEEKIRHAAERVTGIGRLVEVKARWLGHKLNAELTIAIDDSLTVAEANRITVALKEKLHEHLPPLGLVIVQFDTTGLSAAERGSHSHISRQSCEVG